MKLTISSIISNSKVIDFSCK